MHSVSWSSDELGIAPTISDALTSFKRVADIHMNIVIRVKSESLWNFHSKVINMYPSLIAHWKSLYRNCIWKNAWKRIDFQVSIGPPWNDGYNIFG